MILIIISWIYILFTTINLGFGFDKIIGLKNKNFVLFSIFGLFSTTIIATIWAIFGRINLEFHAFLLLLNSFVFWKYYPQIILIYSLFIQKVKELNFVLKLFLIIQSLLIIAQCATIPFVIDNESYYIQTIKWINQYGFVKGLANLHIFFGQTSGWHITQSAFNFSFLYENFNDLSGFCLLLGTIFAIFKMNSYFINQNKIYLIVGLLPLANVLLFQFISAPSPDLSVYIFSFIAFFYFLKKTKISISKNFNIITILSLYILFIKPTAVGLLLLPIIYFLRNFKTLKPELFPSFSLGLLLLGLFITKNLIITGYPFYPTQLFSGKIYDFSVPKELVSFYFDETKLYGFFLTKAEFQSMTYTQIFIKWLTLNKINAIFNCLSILLILGCPIFIYKFLNKKSFWFLYAIMLFQLIVLLLTSPQFRFFIHFIMFFVFFLVSCVIKNKRTLLLLLFGNLFLQMILLFIPLDYSIFTKNKLLTENSRFTVNEFLFPHKNSKINSAFFKTKIGNLDYFSPDKNTYFWTNGDGDLPCVNKQQLDYFKVNFNYIPQLRTKNLKDGFYSKKVSIYD